MRIDKLTLENFCCFENREFSLAENFNLFIGDNGSGKTSILNGLAVGLGGFFASLGVPESTNARRIQKNEARFRSYLQGDAYTRENQFPVAVACDGMLNETSCSWHREMKSFDPMLDLGVNFVVRIDPPMFQNLASLLDARVRAGEAAILPVIIHYGTGRLWTKKPAELIGSLPPGSRFLGYYEWIDPTSDVKRLLAWFKTMEIQALQEKKRIGVLEAVRQAILACVEGATHVWFNIAQDELLLRFADLEIPFDCLSDGYRGMLAMVADIAVRCATLNPALKEAAIRETPGVVLIDEIDLHLHPKWQRHVVRDLLAAFPKVQFVATTHSPFIIQSLIPKGGIKLHNLDKPSASNFADKSIEDIAEEVQGIKIPSRSQRYQDMMKVAERYFTKLRDSKSMPEEERERMKRELDELTLPFSDDPAYQAFLKMQRAASGIDGANGHEAR